MITVLYNLIKENLKTQSILALLMRQPPLKSMAQLVFALCGFHTLRIKGLLS